MEDKSRGVYIINGKGTLNAGSHDVGFKVYNSYGNGYRLTNNPEYKKQIIQGAATLVTRFNKKIGCIRSWDFGTWQYPVIIDNMMNLELLFEATKLSGDSSYYKIAVTHANTTMQNHFRSDFSCYHVMDYDTVTGKPIGGSTLQGYSDRSTWARGHAWALYGFTMCYRETKDPAYLRLAENIASFLINHSRLPVDKFLIGILMYRISQKNREMLQLLQLWLRLSMSCRVIQPIENNILGLPIKS